MDELLLFTIDESFTTLQTDGLLLTILIDELSPQHRWTSSYYLRLTSLLLHFRQTGSLLLFTVTSPSLHFKQTGSFLQFLLMSSPSTQMDELLLFTIDEPFTALQTDGLSPTIHSDEPFTTLQTDGLLLTILIE